MIYTTLILNQSKVTDMKVNEAAIGFNYRFVLWIGVIHRFALLDLSNHEFIGN